MNSYMRDYHRRTHVLWNIGTKLQRKYYLFFKRDLKAEGRKAEGRDSLG